MRETLHISYDVANLRYEMVRLIEEAIDPDRHDAYTAQLADLDQLLARGITHHTTCPTAVEESPGRWVCSGHIDLAEEQRRLDMLFDHDRAVAEERRLEQQDMDASCDRAWRDGRLA